MAIDVNSVKSSVSGDRPSQSAKGSTGAGDINFADLMRNSGARIGNGLMATSDGAGLASAVDRASHSDTYGDRQQPAADDYAEPYDAPDHGADQSSRQADRSVSSQRDDQTRDQVTGGSDYTQPTGESSVEANSGQGDENSGETDHPSSNGENADRPQGPDDHASENAENDTTETTGQAASSGENTGEQTATGGENAANGQGQGTGSNADQILNSLLASAQGAAQTGKANDHAADAGKNAGPGGNAVKGLSGALANATKNNADPTTAAGQGAATTEAGAKNTTGAAAKDGFNLHASQAAQAKGNATAQSGNTDTNAAGQATTAAAAGKEAAAQQSAQLSRMVGNGPKVAVTVETTGESTSMVSKPATSLTSSAALIGENNAQNGRGHQSQNSAGAAAGQTQAAAAQANLGQNQASAAQAAAQAQASGAAGGDAKGPMQATQIIGATGQAAAGVGEGTAVSGSVNTTQQAQNSAQPQAANAPRFATPGQAVTDQVTVQITKALNAGVDKISIHLKPADLGRVDVKMEIGLDGRVSAVVTADNKNTLDLLQKDSKELQQALQDAGLQMDNDSLSFNLREQGGEQQTADSDLAGNGSDNPDVDENGLGDQLAAQIQDIISDTRVDIRA